MARNAGWLTILLLAALVFGCEGEVPASDAPFDAAAGDLGTTDTRPGEDGSVDAAAPVDIGLDAITAAWTCPGRSIFLTDITEGSNIQSVLQAEVDAASDGDCVVLAAGDYVLDGTVVVDRRVSVLGHGSADGGTQLRRRDDASDGDVQSWRRMLDFAIGSREPSGIVLAGIRFTSKTPSIVSGDGGSLARDGAVRFSGAVDFVVTDCRFEFFGAGAVEVRHEDDLSRGLIYENEFFHNLKGSGLGLGYGVVLYGANESWTESPEFGSDNFIFIEDNLFTEHRHSTAAGGAARYVVRHNEIVDNLWGHAIDAHEGRRGGIGTTNHFSTRAVEAYNNVLRNTRFRATDTGPGDPIEPDHNLNDLAAFALMFRGGEAVVHHNTVTDYLIEVGFTTFEHDWAGGYPIPTQLGYQSAVAHGESHSGIGDSEAAGDVFVWDNDFTPYNESAAVHRYRNNAPEYLAEGRDYHIGIPRPGYAPYTYPHPGRISWLGPAGVGTAE